MCSVSVHTEFAKMGVCFMLPGSQLKQKGSIGAPPHGAKAMTCSFNPREAGLVSALPYCVTQHSCSQRCPELTQGDALVLTRSRQRCGREQPARLCRSSTCGRGGAEPGTRAGPGSCHCCRPDLCTEHGWWEQPARQAQVG